MRTDMGWQVRPCWVPSQTVVDAADVLGDIALGLSRVPAPGPPCFTVSFEKPRYPSKLR